MYEGVSYRYGLPLNNIDPMQAKFIVLNVFEKEGHREDFRWAVHFEVFDFLPLTIFIVFYALDKLLGFVEELKLLILFIMNFYTNFLGDFFENTHYPPLEIGHSKRNV